ncbi:sugar-binding transcriptional regulator [Haloimpatiens sp. FM7330]|uniref:sugar-binding transcriptional regulator n=1 Tax=Haloimpatiens sp. FM7330 TaxID=3298610 RepID=UPI003634F6B2
MHEILKLQKKIVPELIEVIEKRYTILRGIYYNQPIGRRILANKLGIGERIVRTEINFLKNQNLIEVNTPGMTVTNDGEEILEKLKEFIHEIKGLSTLENYIKKNLKLKDVVVVPGDIEDDITVMNELGKAGANYIKDKLSENTVISLTGGSTVKSIVDNIPKINKVSNILVLPARGGMGRDVETQSNTLTARLAEKINANYRLMHVPDNLSDNALNAILNEKNIKEIIDKIKSCNILIYGIGKAEEMAIRRGMTDEEVKKLLDKGAVAEAFGYYFDENGDIVDFTPTIGIRREDIKNIDISIAIAGGKSKSKAILATELNMKSGILITDEGVANEIVTTLENQSK